MVYTFGDWLKQELKIRDMIQADLVKKTGLTRGAISHLVTGRNQPTLETCQKIARAFNLPDESVLIIAGIMVSKTKTSPQLEEINMILSQLPPEEREDILEYARLRARINERRGNYAADSPLAETG